MRVTADVKTATRKRIVDASQKLFARQGFESTTTRDIASAAKIGVGTLFNYFPTKESIVSFLVTDAFSSAEVAFVSAIPRERDLKSCSPDSESCAEQLPSFEEELFSYCAVVLRKLKPYRKYLPAVLETTLSPLADDPDQSEPSLRQRQTETLVEVASRHQMHAALSPVALQLYWTLFTGILAFWANDRSPRQEDTLALMDQSISMFVGWLNAQSDSISDDAETKER